MEEELSFQIVVQPTYFRAPLALSGILQVLRPRNEEGNLCPSRTFGGQGIAPVVFILQAG